MGKRKGAGSGSGVMAVDTASEPCVQQEGDVVKRVGSVTSGVHEPGQLRQ